MLFFRQYVLSLTVTALISGILLSFFSGGITHRLLRFICGVILAVTALQPFSRLEIPDPGDWAREYREFGEAAAAMGRDMAELEWLGSIRSALEAYILDKAAAMGLEVSAVLSLDADGTPLSVRITGDPTPDQRQQLETTITNDLGIPGEAQKWITKKGSRP